MSNADVHSVRKTFLIKSGFSPVLSHDALAEEFVAHLEAERILSNGYSSWIFQKFLNFCGFPSKP
jgi:hypothetical protein